MDKLRLNIKANDELQTDLKDLYDVMIRLSLLSSDFEGKMKVQKWYVTLEFVFIILNRAT